MYTSLQIFKWNTITTQKSFSRCHLTLLNYNDTTFNFTMSVIYLAIKFLFHCPFISNHCSFLILANHAIPNMNQDNPHSVMKNHNTSMRFVTGQQLNSSLCYILQSFHK